MENLILLKADSLLLSVVYGVFTDNKKYSLITLTLLWTILWVLFALSSVNNTINLLPFSMAVLSFIIARREVY